MKTRNRQIDLMTELESKASDNRQRKQLFRQIWSDPVNYFCANPVQIWCKTTMIQVAKVLENQKLSSATEQIVRTITENARTLKFMSQGFEEE